MYYHYLKWKKCKSLSCLDPLQPHSCSRPGSSVHGILQARTLEWVAIPFFRGCSQPRDWTWVSLTAGRFFTVWATRNKPKKDDFPICSLFLRVVYHEMLKQVYKGDTTGFMTARRITGPCKMPPITSQPVRTHQPATDRSTPQPTAVSQTGACKETLGSSEWACDASGTQEVSPATVGSMRMTCQLVFSEHQICWRDNMPATCPGKHTLGTISLTTGLQVEHIQLRISKHLKPTFWAADALNPNQLAHE